MIGLSDDAEARARFTAFREGLAALGWIDGRNIEIIARFGTASADRTRAVVEELVRLEPEAIVTSNPAVVSALMEGTHSIPIVFTMMPDPIALGFATSLAHPGGNATGFTSVEQGMAGKWLELLREVAPHVTRVAMLVDPDEPGGALLAGALETAALSLTVRSTAATVRDDTEIERFITAFAGEPNGGLIVPPSARLSARRALLLMLASRHGIPVIYSYRHFVANGGLMSYGPDVLDLYRRPATYIDQIFKGAKPGDLPIQQPTKFELVVNLMTAKVLGLAIPESFLLRADEVIE
jgi:putative ABC transport system substrate-binding protein